MAIKKSVYLSTPTQEWIESTSNGKWSEAINATFDQIQYLVKKNCPELEQDEWDELKVLYKDDPFPAFKTDINIAFDLMRSLGALEIYEISNKDKALVSRLRDLTYIKQLAVLYTIQGWRQ